MKKSGGSQGSGGRGEAGDHLRLVKEQLFDSRGGWFPTGKFAPDLQRSLRGESMHDNEKPQLANLPWIEL